MLSKKANAASQLSFYNTFEEQLSHQHPLYILANKIEGHVFEEAFKKHYSDQVRPAKPIRLMVALFMLVSAPDKTGLKWKIILVT